MKNAKEVIRSLHPNWKLWFEKNGKYVFGPGAYHLLKAIQETESITYAARSVGMSYRYAWGVIKKIERELGIQLIRTYKGGAVGGGGANVTETGKLLMKRYAEISKAFEDVSAVKAKL